jgi:hypothetical protein
MAVKGFIELAWGRKSFARTKRSSLFVRRVGEGDEENVVVTLTADRTRKTKHFRLLHSGEEFGISIDAYKVRTKF